MLIARTFTRRFAQDWQRVVFLRLSRGPIVRLVTFLGRTHSSAVIFQIVRKHPTD